VKRLASSILLALSIGSTPGSTQAPVRLAKPDAEFPDPFTRLASVRELPGGRVLISDTQDKTVQLLDFAAGSATKIGREGQGPGEYALPAALIALPGNQTLLQDILARRYLEIGSDGKVGGTVSLPSRSNGPGGMIIGTGAQRGDAQGRIYFQAPPFDPANPNRPPADSLAILRWDRVKPDFDTAGWIGVQRSNVNVSGGGGRFAVRIGGGKVFEPEEAWGVAGDGSIARVLPAPFRVMWYSGSGGAPIAGPEQPWTPIKVTEADKQAAIEARKRLRPMMVAIGAGGRSAAPPPNVSIPDPEFAETKPPFSGPNAALVSSDGEVWVLKNQPAGVENPIYDVFDRAGKLIRKVTLAPRSRVMGFGERTVYVVRTDEDDLEYLQRHVRP
jgi:hypothetical protein